MANSDDFPVTQTKPGISKREMATATIAEKLGIAATEVKDDTPLGNSGQEISTVVCFLTGVTIFGSSNMTASDIFRQLK